MKSNPIGATPIGGADLDPAQGGGLTAVRLRDGSQTWYAPAHPCNPVRPGCSPAQSAALTSIPGIVFSGSIDGHLRAFTMTDGKMVWDYDSVHDYSTVDGVAAKGGSMDGAGPVVVDGMVYVNSGYPRFGGMPGNVLLAFSREGK
jgi:polyvinyl alcohol dehydrogenase (cytochrome)